MPLTQSQLDHIARRLREERARILRELERYDERLAATESDAAGDISRFPTHAADEATDAFDRELDAQETSRLGRELAEIDAALDRLYRTPERFGRDERTGEDIPFERLELVPWARARVADVRHATPSTDARSSETPHERIVETDRSLADHYDRYAG
jgi:DnaK suppressor protein